MSKLEKLAIALLVIILLLGVIKINLISSVVHYQANQEQVTLLEGEISDSELLQQFCERWPYESICQD